MGLRNQEVNKIIASKCNLGRYPSTSNLSKTYLKTFWILEIAEKEYEIDRLNSAQMALLLTEKFRINTSQQAIDYALKHITPGLVNKKNGKYKLMMKGRELLYESTKKDTTSALIIEPEKPFTGKRILINEVLSKLEGTIKICDPYCGPKTLDLLHKLNNKSKIMILTYNIEDKPKGCFQRVLEDFRKEKPNIEIRIYNKSDLHDRYIISNDVMWFSGHSIKDLGKKEAFLIKLGKDVRDSMEEVFLRRWKISKVI